MNDSRPTSGKIRALQAASSPAGIFRILAVDHRAVLVKMMDRDGRGNVAADEITRLKLDLVRRIGPLATAVILDTQYGALQAVEGKALPERVSLLVSLPGDASPDRSAWSVRRAREIGASGVKLYLAYHPAGGERTRMQELRVRELVSQCAEEGIALFLEPVATSINPDVPTDSARFARQRRRIVVETAARLGALGPDVLKLQFPIDAHDEPAEAVWRAACAELNDASPVPWALLSAGEPFETFQTQLQIACEAGASGFMAGRAVWSEVATAEPSRRGAIVEEIVRPRIETLNRIAERWAHGWAEKCPPAARAKL